jgi:hypothetical protein
MLSIIQLKPTSKNSILRLLIFSITISFSLVVNAQTLNSWYVDKNASGSNNGTSWTNAWQSFSAINWTSIAPGETLYISGGTDSTVYNETLAVGGRGTSGHQLVITKGTSTGHNGKVIINGGGTRSNCVNFGVTNDFVTLSRLYMTNSTGSIVNATAGMKGSFGSYYYTDPHEGIRIEHCELYLTLGSGIALKGSKNYYGYHNYIHDVTNTSSQTDGYFIQASKDFTIDGDSIIISNTNSTPHCDAIQMNQDTNGVVKNCYTEHTDSKTSNSQCIYGTGGFGNIVYYNNVANMGTASSNAITVQQLSGNYNSITMIGNTVYNNSTTGMSHGLWVDTFPGTPIIKNNIVACYNHSGVGIYVSSGNYGGTDHNLQYNVNATRGTNILTSDPLFTNRNAKNFTLQSGSPARDAGATLGTFYNTDKNGTTRPIGTAWDIGAYEYTVAGPDIISPQLIGSAIINPTLVELTFSESIEQASAQNNNSYSINNGIVISSAVQVSGNKVRLQTTQHQPNVTYTVVVNNIKDLAGNVISSSNNSAQYSYVGDTTPPTLVSAAVLSSTSVQLLFSEGLDNSSAQNKSNYSINNGVTVSTAALSTDKKKVTLTTSQFTTNTNYIVTVSNVKDLAGNIISSNNTATYSFVDNTVGNLKANLKVFLEGPYQNGGMATALYDNELLPSSQPYSVAPWFYNGNESFSSSPSTTVDWILVELRSSQNPTQVISRRAGLLRNDGRIMETNGSLGITFNNVLYGSYYLAVFHRNHLSIMSSVPVLFAPDNTLYDFTTAQLKAYGQSAMDEIKTGVFGMYSGDGDDSGNIDDADRNNVWTDQNGKLGYLNGDFNLDSGVTIIDINEFWNLNNGKTTQVP